jgi:hypothetical protein
MQPGGDLQDAWIMFDHVKRVKHWTTMAYHVYNSTYYQVIIVAIYNMQSEDVVVQSILWKNLNAVMAKHGMSKSKFKRFMV